MESTRRFERAGVALSLVCIGVLAGGCGGDEPGDGASTTSGGAPEGCAPGEMPLEDGGCQPAGVPPDRCGAGFEADGAMGCNAVLPPEACPAGSMAIPGEVACRPVAPCPAGDYGDIPVEPTTQFVNGAYAGADSDGTQARPWTSIQDGMDAAAPGAIVAVAAGTYHEWLDLRFKAVRLWGRCPSMVEVVGDATGQASVFLEDGIAGTEIRDLAITGSQRGVSLSGSENVLLDRVWIHDMGVRGINVQNDWGPTAITVSRSLIEGCDEFGLYVSGSRLVLEDSVVRDTRAVLGNFGRGLEVQVDEGDQVRAEATVRGSVLERNREVGVYIGGADATIDRTVVRDTLPQESDGLYGRGIAVEDSLETGEGSTMLLTASVIERSRDVGVFITRSKATIEHTVVRDTLPAEGNMQGGRGIAVQPFDGVPAEAEIRWSVIERSTEAGLFWNGSIGTIEGLRVRDTRSRPLTLDRGLGMVMQTQEPGLPLTLRWCMAERNREIGISFLDHDGVIDACAVLDTQPTESDAAYGDGFAASAPIGPRAVTVTGSLFQGSARSAVSAFGGAVTVQGTTLECNAIDLDTEVVHDQPGTFSDQGGNRCGCGDQHRECKAVSSNLEAPEPLSSSE